MPKLLTVNDLRITYRGLTDTVEAVRGISLSLAAGEALGIVGESGCGKSSLALALMGLLQGDRVDVTGELQLEGRDLIGLSRSEWEDVRGREMGMIFQDPMTSLNPYLRVGKQVMEPLQRHQGMGSEEGRARVLELFKQVGIEDAKTRIDCYPHEFSGGMRQRVMIATALSCEPKVLIADEPTTALDVITQAQVLKMMRGMMEAAQMGLILITHDLGVVAGLCDRVVVMRDGQIVEAAPVAELYANPQHEYTKSLLASVPRIDGDKARRLSAVAGAGAGKAKAALPTQLTSGVDAATENKEVLIGATDICVTFEGKKNQAPVQAVKHVSIDVYKGEVLGLVGQSGSGKSTLIRALLQLRQPEQGKVIYQGRDLVGCSGKQRRELWREWQLIFQDPYASLNSRMTIEQIIAEPLINYEGLSLKTARPKVYALMERVQLNPAWASRFPHEFSGGQRQRIGIARALALNPKVIFCDEPVSALDVSIQAEVINLLQDLQREMGLTLFFISHDLAVVRHIADRVAVMHQGEIVECLPAADIFTKSEHPYTKALLDAIPIPDPTLYGR